MTKQQLQEIFESEFKWQNWKRVMDFVFPEFKFNLVQTDLLKDTKAHQKSAGYIKEHGHIELEGAETLTLCEILVKDNIRLDRNIKSVRSLVADLAAPEFQTIIAVFHNADNSKWRFTLVVKELSADFEVKDKKPDSYTYVFGIGEKGRTAAERFFDLAHTPGRKTRGDLERAFSVKALSDQFFDEYKYKHFNGFIRYLTGEEIIKVDGKDVFIPASVPDLKGLTYLRLNFKNDKKEAREFVKKLLGRLVFIRFLEKKRWMGATSTNYSDGLQDFCSELFQSSKQDEGFYYAHLCRLFFETLNRKREDDGFLMPDGRLLKVPYLNGGLFQQEVIDEKIIEFPPMLFEEVFSAFHDYNFTIIEDDPDLKEVAVDPEMLGRIFENLLEDNKDKGAYYTPKEIVHYMCQESLFEYLQTYLLENNLWPENSTAAIELKKSLEKFVKKKLASGVIHIDKQLAAALRDVKICDPAIGSGAFPMGLLNEIYHCVHKLHDESPHNVGDVWGIGEEWEGNKVKLNIIQNSIYGVDIEKGAVDIARLRFWLSLIFDEEVPKPLPNLDFKIVVGNSLVPSFSNSLLQIEWDIRQPTIESERPEYKTKHGRLNEELQNQQRANLDKVVKRQQQFFNADEKQKAKIQNEIQQLKLLIIQVQLRRELLKIGKVKEAFGQTGLFAASKKDSDKHLSILEKEGKLRKLERLVSNKIAHKDTSFSHFDWKLDFPEILNDALTDKPGFDIVIANPPYLNVELMDRELKEFFKSQFKTFYKRSDIFGVFLEFSLEKLLKRTGKLAFIIPSTVLNNLSYKLLRNEILNNRWLKTVCYTGNSIFTGVTVDTVILILDKCGSPHITLMDALDFDAPKTAVVPSGYFEKFENVISVSTDNDADSIFEKLFAKENINIESCFDVFQGIVTGNNPVYIFDEPRQLTEKNIEESVLKPLLHGRDIGKWTIKNTSRRIIYLSPRMKISDYPLTKKYLLGFKDELSRRRECVNGAIPWYSLQWARDQAQLDIVPKIVIQNTRNERLRPRIVGTVDELGMYGSQGLNFVVPKGKKYSVYFLVGIINSKLIDFLFSTKFLNLAIKAEYVKQISFPTPSQRCVLIIEKLTKSILDRKRNGKTIDELENELNTVIYKYYNLSFEEIKVIEPGFAVTKEDYESMSVA